MRNICLFLGLSLLLSACNTKSASAYNDVIISEQEKVMASLMEFGNAVTSGQMDKAEEARVKGLDQTEKSIDELESLDDFQGNTEFRDAALELVRFYNEAFKNDYKDVIELVKKETNMTPEDYARLAEIERHLTSKEREANKKLLDAQNRFAKEHNFTVEENAMQKEIDERE